MTYDGSNLWITDSAGVNTSYKMDASGAVFFCMAAPGNRPLGLAFDGIYLWHADASDGTIFKLIVDPENDTDGDGTPDCIDNCPNDPNKTEPGNNGCGNSENEDGSDNGDDGDGGGGIDCFTMTLGSLWS